MSEKQAIALEPGTQLKTIGGHKVNVVRVSIAREGVPVTMVQVDWADGSGRWWSLPAGLQFIPQ